MFSSGCYIFKRIQTSWKRFSEEWGGWLEDKKLNSMAGVSNLYMITAAYFNSCDLTPRYLYNHLPQQTRPGLFWVNRKFLLLCKNIFWIKILLTKMRMDRKMNSHAHGYCLLLLTSNLCSSKFHYSEESNKRTWSWSICWFSRKMPSLD